MGAGVVRFDIFFWCRMKIRRWFDQKQIELEPHHLLGKGSKRLCYRFPGRAALCIKVARPELPWSFAQKQSFAEDAYLEYLKRRDGAYPDEFPKLYGWIPTNHGPGLVSERIINSGGENSVTLRQLLETGQISISNAVSIMEGLVDRAVQRSLLISDWNTANVMLKGQNKKKPVLIDGFGPKTQGIKGFVFTRFRGLARNKTRRSWKRQQNKVLTSIRESAIRKIH